MNKFLFKIILFTFSTMLVLIIIDVLVTNGLRKTESSTFKNLNKIHDSSINTDLIINGSSKALVQVSPVILDTILNIETYNLGMDGTEFLPQLTQYQLYQKYNPNPQIIIQIVGNSFLVKKTKLYGFEKFAPYLHDENVRELTKIYKAYDLVDYFIPLIRYSGMYAHVINGLLNNFNLDVKKDTKYKGYFPQDTKWDDSFDKFKKENKDGVILKMDSLSKVNFEAYIQDCLNSKIKLFLVYPPTYIESQEYIKNRNEIINYYEQIANKFNVPFLDYSKCDISNVKKFFYNSQHLNKQGAEVFTATLAKDIKNYSKK